MFIAAVARINTCGLVDWHPIHRFLQKEYQERKLLMSTAGTSERQPCTSVGVMCYRLVDVHQGP
jgi:hypothetical protein